MSSNIIIISISVLFSLLSSCTRVQRTSPPKLEETSNYLRVVYSQCAGADVLEVESTEDGCVEVEFLCDGKLYEVLIKNNSVVYNERKLDKTEIPFDKIRRKLGKKYQGWILDEVSEVKANDTLFLKAEIMKDGIEQNLYFTSDGKWFKMKPIDKASRWDVNKLTDNDVYAGSDYAFLNPDSTYELPDLLREVSGIHVAKNRVYCVQDELGAVFCYDLHRQSIASTLRFTDIGDFEDVTYLDNRFFVLRSDGTVFSCGDNEPGLVTQTIVPVNSLNVEGICHHNGYFYIACKDVPADNDELPERMIYRSPTANLARVESYLRVNVEMIREFVTQHYPELGLDSLTFNPSAIAFHPLTGQLYVLSASERAIAIFEGMQLQSVVLLPPETYYKPEGISFWPNGDMIISNEGDKKGYIRGNLCLLKYKKQ